MKPQDVESVAGAPSEAALARVVEGYFTELENGRRPDEEALLAAHPEIADRLRACFHSLKAMQQAAGELAQPFDPVSELADAGRLGDFRILRQLGRGGMGVVYQSKQISLGRRVALKVLPFAAMLDPRHLQRFKNEALAAAALEHPNIVGIYSVGCERGVHYYAMQYVDGQTLAQVIAQLRSLSGTPGPGAEPELLSPVTENLVSGCAEAGRKSGMEAPPTDLAPTPPAHAGFVDTQRDPQVSISVGVSIRSPQFFRSVAQLGIQAAEGLEHAHQMGVIHRDIKPSNLMVDASGHLWVTDFGLAMTQKDPGLTMTGDILGTLRYMSPEQASGERRVLDCRTDIYSLGATLYELVTLQPTFGGEDRQSLLRQIADEEPPRPRQVNRAIARDLETIILKAIAKEPGFRYVTAQALADDLRRFLDDKPIQARRPSPLERATKWSRRHRPVVWAAVALLVLATIASVISTLVIAAERRRTLEAYEEKDQQLIATQKAEQLAREQEELAKRQQRLAKEQEQLAEQQRKLAMAQKDEAIRQRDAAEHGRYVSDIRLAQNNWTTGQSVRLREVLNAQLPGPARRDFRGWEWYYLFSQCYSERLNLPFQSFHQIAWSPDGKHLATVGGLDAINVWDVSSGKRKGFLKTWLGVGGISWSPDGKYLAAATAQGAVDIWDVASGGILRSLHGHLTLPFGLDWNPDGVRLASGGCDGRIRIWDVHRGKTLSSLEVAGRIVWSLHWHPDGRHLLAVLGENPNVAKELKIWDTLSGSEVAGWPTNGQEAAFSPDGSRVVWGRGLACVTTWKTGRLVSSFQQRGGRNNAWSPDGRRLASPASDGPINIWDAETGTKILTIPARMGPGGRVAWSPKGSLLAAGYDDGTVVVHDTAAAEQARTFSIPDRYALSVRFSPDGKRLLVGARHGLLRIYDLESGETTLQVQHGLRWLCCVAWSPDGKRFAVPPDDRSVLIHDAKTGKPVLPPLRCDGYPRSLAWSPDGQTLAVGLETKEPGHSRGRVVLFCASTGRQLAASAIGDWYCHWVAWRPDGKRLAASGKRLRVWDSALREELPVANIPAVSLAWSFDGKQVAVADGTPDTGNGTIRIYDATSWVPTAEIVQPSDDVVCLAWHPHMPRLASGNQRGTIRIWDTSSGQEVLALETSAETVYHRIERLDWSPDGLRLASAGRDCTVRIWDASIADRFLKRQPDLRAKAATLITEKKFEEAIDLLQRLRAPHPEDLELQMLMQRAKLAYANQLVRDDQLHAATATYRQLCAEAPDLPDYQLWLPGALFQPPNQTKALEMLEKLVADFPEKQEYRDELAYRYEIRAMYLCQVGQLEQAVPILLRLAEGFPERPDFRGRLAFRMILRDRRDDILAALEKIGKAAARWPDFRPELARSLVVFGRWADAIRVYERLVSEFPQEPSCRAELAGTYARWAGDWVSKYNLYRGIVTLRQLVQSQPEIPPAWLHWISCWGALAIHGTQESPGIVFVSDMPWVRSTCGRGAGEALRDAWWGSTDMAGLPYSKGVFTHAFDDARPADVVLDISGEKSSSFKAHAGPRECGGSARFQVLVDGKMKHETPVLRRGAVEAISVDVAGAKQIVLRVLNGGDGATSHSACWGYARFIRVGEADPLEEPPAELKPLRHVEAAFFLATIHERLNQNDHARRWHDSAAQWLEQIHPDELNNPWVYFHRASLHASQGDFGKTVADLTENIRLSREAADSHDPGAVASLTKAEFDEVLTRLSKLVQLEPKNAEEWHMLSLVRLGAGRTGDFRNTCAEMLRRFAQTEKAQDAHWTAWTCALAPDAVADWPKVVALAEKAAQSDPQSPSYVTALGASFYRAGSYEQALQRLTEADGLLREPSERSSMSPAYTWLFLAMAHHRLAHAAEAQKWLDKAIGWTDKALQEHAADTGVRLDWPRRATLKLLRDEAEALMGKAEGGRGKAEEKNADRARGKAEGGREKGEDGGEKPEDGREKAKELGR